MIFIIVCCYQQKHPLIMLRYIRETEVAVENPSLAGAREGSSGSGVVRAGLREAESRSRSRRERRLIGFLTALLQPAQEMKPAF